MREQRGSGAVAWLAAAVLMTMACGEAGTPIERAEDRRLAGAPELLEALATGEPEVRARAALAMGRIQHPGYVPPLVQAARSGEPAEVRSAALFALGQLGLASGAEPVPAAVEACRTAVGDADPGIVALAVEALGKLADPDSVELLTETLGHPDPTLRAEAAHGLFRLRFVPVWRGQTETAPEWPDPAATALIAALADPDAGVRGAAAHAFARHAEPRAIEALAAALRDDDRWVRLWSLRALGRVGDPAVTGAVVAAIADPDPQIRSAALDALAALDRPALAPPAALFDEAFQVRAALARLWRLADDETSIEFLRRLSQDASPTVRAAAIDALAHRLGDAFILGMDFHLKDAPWPVRAAVARASAHLPDKGLEYSLRLLRDEDVRVQTAALEALRDRPRVERHIVQALTSDDLALRGTAVGLIADAEMQDKLGTLQRVYDASAGDRWIEVRETIVDALEGVEGAADVLETIYRDDAASSVRARARRVLQRAGRELPEVEPPAVTPSLRLGKHFGADPRVVLETSKGAFEIRAFAAEAPVHVASFVALVEDGFYDGLAWHRVVPNFVIQGGDPRGDGWGSGGIVLRDEINRRRFARGTVGMPKAGKDTGGCQLFVTHVPTPHLDGNYTVFGEVVRGLEVVDAIEVGDTIVRAFVKPGD